MSMLFAALAQAVSAAPAQPIDLTISPPCLSKTTESDEVIVCANRADGLGPYRIRQAPSAAAKNPKAEAQLADGLSVAAQTESADIGGFPAKRAMLRLKLKF